MTRTRKRRTDEEAALLRARVVALSSEGLSARMVAERINDELPPGDPYRVTAGYVRVILCKDAPTRPDRPRAPDPPSVAVTPSDEAAVVVPPERARSAREAWSAAHAQAAQAGDAARSLRAPAVLPSDEAQRFAAVLEHLEVVDIETAAEAAGASAAEVGRWLRDDGRRMLVRRASAMRSLAARRRLRDIALGVPIEQGVRDSEAGVLTVTAPADVRTQATAARTLLEVEAAAARLRVEAWRLDLGTVETTDASPMQQAERDTRVLFAEMLDVDLMAVGEEG